ncbi:TetR family transcriptional regulator [Mycolicibacterium sediminis]|uniref:TetR family transcriptional regulator n=1 Tax=Mycolicibacterium sediminis TaxID=1286180 RepID=A0A7I7QZT7_9MYCO|nr:TetR family transcriptional regulator [Mycolicibacterium sediminis]BBY31884.1 TetR family transcriptional regulator [Mycolicibacterium sediminis]
MSDLVAFAPARGGLREHKKRRTRASLIEAAADLCRRNGYDNTTVDQIAAAADVAPRTFSRYFPNKECVVAAITDDLDDLIAEAMETLPDDITVYDALLQSSIEVLSTSDGSETAGFRRLALLIEIINGSTSFRASALALRHDVTNRATMKVMARRMGVPEGDRAVALVTDTWAVIFSDSFAGLGRPGNEPVRPDVICDRLSATVELFRRTWSPYDPPSRRASQPHTSASEG